MKEIILLRHGDTDATENHYFAGWSDIPLSEKGERRILLAKEWLRNYDFQEIWVSPLTRTRQTAGLVLDHDRSLVLDEALMERSFGSWEGKSWEELEKEFPEQVTEWKKSPLEFTPPRGESFAQVLVRVKRFWNDLETRGDGTYLIVTHAGVIRCLLVLLTGMSFENSFHLLLDPGVAVKVRQTPEFTHIVAIANHEGVEC